MAGDVGSSPLSLDRPEVIHRVREVFDRVGFDDSHIPEHLGVKDMAALSLGPSDRPRLSHRTQDGAPLSTLIRLFLVGLPVAFDAFKRSVEPLAPADWAELGLVEIGADLVHRAVGMRPSRGLIIAHDCTLPDGSQRHDHVLGLSGSTLTFASAMIQPPSRYTLDLGTGSGYLALLAARHNQRVLATDRNPRAVNMTRFNALLNGLANVEAAAGDLFEPVGEKRFDVIVSNPPFVVSPEDEIMFRDSGMKGDEICERIVRAAPAHLAEGGYAQFLCNWVRLAGQDWRARLTDWISGSGCDAWFMHLHTDATDVYASHWLGQVDQTDLERNAARFERWMAYYKEQSIEAIDSGMITLRRRSGACNWVAFDTDRGRNQPNGAAVLLGFAARDLIQRLGDDRAVLDLKPRCQSELRLVQHLKPAGQGWLVDEARCVLGDGLQFEGSVSPLVFHLLALCRGQEPLRAVLAQVASRLGQDRAAVLAEGLGVARSLVAQGFLTCGDPEPSA
jgi:predicted RNA methylase